MLKKLFVLMCMLGLLTASGCFEKNAAWIYGNPESQGMAGIRLGNEIAQNLEVGAAVNYMPSDGKTTTKTCQIWKFKKTITTVEKEAQDSWEYGAYTLYHFPDVVKGVSPYVGAQVNIGQGKDVIDTLEPIGGIVLGNMLFAEYQRESLYGEDNKVLFGLRFRF